MLKLIGVLLASLIAQALPAQLQVTYGAKGVQTISYNGVTLEDVGQYSSDQFHIWHITATDLQGNSLSDGDRGWGENSISENWNPATATETYTTSWGSITVQHVASGNKLDSIVTMANAAGSGVIIGGANIYPFALHFPNDPVGFYGYSQFAPTTIGPGIVAADYGTGVATAVVVDPTNEVYGGWDADGTNTYVPLMTTTSPSDLASYFPHNNSNLMPGTSLTYTVSVRFTNEGVAADISDAAANYRKVYPATFHWSDRRVIGTAYLASNSSSGNGNANSASGCGTSSTNPRNYKVAGSVNCSYNVNSVGFQDNILSQAASIVTNAAALKAQGVITWDVEGEEYPQDTSYVCAPDQIDTLAPEMDQSVTDPNFPAYQGMELVDAYFKIQTDAGLRVGVCLRPQNFVVHSGGSAEQVFATSDAQAAGFVEQKARYANKRWGATLFYVDSAVNSDGGVMNPNVWHQVSTDLPGWLFSPEEQHGQLNAREYADCAPFFNFLDNGDLGTLYDPTYAIRAVYPEAFGLNLINDVWPDVLTQYTPQLTAGVAGGDVLMAHADYDQANNAAVEKIYASVPTKPTSWLGQVFRTLRLH